MKKKLVTRLMSRMYEHAHRVSKIRRSDYFYKRKDPTRVLESGGLYCNLSAYHRTWFRGNEKHIKKEKAEKVLLNLSEQEMLANIEKFEQAISDITPLRKPRSPEAIAKAKQTRAINKLKNEIEDLRKEIIESAGLDALIAFEEQNDPS